MRISKATAKRMGVKAPATPKYRPKYRNVKSGGFDSKKEEKRWGELHLLAMAGKITYLQKQVRFNLWVNDQFVCDYICDFFYLEEGTWVVEDVKSPATRKNRAYRIKLKLLKAIYGYEIRET